MSTPEENKAIVLRDIKEVVEQGRVELIDSYYAPDGSVPEMATPAQWRERILWYHKTCPGFKVTILDMMAEGDKVMTNTRFDLTYSVPVDPPPDFFPPLGQAVSWQNMHVCRIVDGKMVAKNSVTGMNNMLVKIGVIPVKQIVQNKAAVRKFVDGLNQSDTALLAEVCTPEVAKQFMEMLPGMYGRYKDHHIDLGTMVADGEGLAVKLNTSGYHTDVVYNLPATGKHWTNQVFAFVRFEEGKIAEVNLMPNVANLIKQLGGVIQPGAA